MARTEACEHGELAFGHLQAAVRLSMLCCYEQLHGDTSADFGFGDGLLRFVDDTWLTGSTRKGPFHF